MTLILGLANQQQVILVSDRRLTHNSEVVEEESNKAAILTCRNARLAVAFTGLAQVGAFSTRQWILEALSKSVDPDYLMEPLIRRFCNRASKDISKINLTKKSDKRLSVILTGYCYDEVPPRCYFWLVSNFEGLSDQSPTLSEPTDEFKIEYLQDERPSQDPHSMLIAIGMSKAVTKGNTFSLYSLLKQNKPAHAIVNKSVEVLRTLAESPLSYNLIGKQCTSIVLPSDPNITPLTEYHTSKVTSKMFEPSFVEARGGDFGVFVIDSPEYQILGSTGQPLIAKVPKVGRNELCPCGSGKKYKRCHGRL